LSLIIPITLYPLIACVFYRVGYWEGRLDEFEKHMESYEEERWWVI
jgi:hypothetical protein